MKVIFYIILLRNGLKIKVTLVLLKILLQKRKEFQTRTLFEVTNVILTATVKVATYRIKTSEVQVNDF